MEGYTLAIDFPVSMRLRDLTARLDEQVYEAGGRIYLGKDAMLEESTFKKMYPQFKDWQKLKERYDPENTFTSDLSRRLGMHR